MLLFCHSSILLLLCHGGILPLLLLVYRGLALRDSGLLLLFHSLSNSGGNLFLQLRVHSSILQLRVHSSILQLHMSIRCLPHSSSSGLLFPTIRGLPHSSSSGLNSSLVLPAIVRRPSSSRILPFAVYSLLMPSTRFSYSLSRRRSHSSSSQAATISLSSSSVLFFMAHSLSHSFSSSSHVLFFMAHSLSHSFSVLLFMANRLSSKETIISSSHSVLLLSANKLATIIRRRSLSSRRRSRNHGGLGAFLLLHIYRLLPLYLSEASPAHQRSRCPYRLLCHKYIYRRKRFPSTCKYRSQARP